MDIKRALPRPQLRGVVRSFEERRAELGIAVLTWPVAARPHQILNIHLAEPYRVRIDGGPANTTPVMDICRFADGKLVEHWGVPDRFALLHQLGALPPPPKRT